MKQEKFPPLVKSFIGENYLHAIKRILYQFVNSCQMAPQESFVIEVFSPAGKAPNLSRIGKVSLS